jgi:hypothetical protein
MWVQHPPLPPFYFGKIMNLEKAKAIANATEFQGDPRVGMLQALNAAKVLARHIEKSESGYLREIYLDINTMKVYNTTQGQPHRILMREVHRVN